MQVYGVQHPAQIVNYRTMGSTPTLLAGALALGSVRRAGHDPWGVGSPAQTGVGRAQDTRIFSRRQLAATVCWQASTSVVIGTVIGIPLGIALGRYLWTLFANELYAVPQPTVSVPAVVGVALGALLLANLVAAIPAWRAARTPTALILRSE